MASNFNTEKVGWTSATKRSVTIWSWGANTYGQLGQGHCEDVLVPRQVDDVCSSIRQVCGGGGHTLVISDKSELWVCGSNNKGQLGLGNTSNKDRLTLASTMTFRVAMAAGGWDFSLVLTEMGEVFSCGSNTFGQLGHPDLPEICTSFTKITLDEPVVQVAAGLRHSVALSGCGNVFCWGHAKKGQCRDFVDGKPSLKFVSPVKVDCPGGAGKVISVVAGSYHTAALSDTGVVLVWGCNKYGLSTLDPGAIPKVMKPHWVEQTLFDGNKVTCIKTGWSHLICQTENGDLYSWGRCDYGQLGRSRTPHMMCSYIPEKIKTEWGFVSFECGSEHTLFMSDNHKLYAVGWNEHGLCGTGDEENVESIRRVSHLDSVIQIGCGGGHCYAITGDKTLFTEWNS